MAHRCWGLDEIVRAIAASLVSDKARASAVSLASCSKSLEEPALGEVWRNLSSLAPLVKCFPPEVWEVKDEKLVSTIDGVGGVSCVSNRSPTVFQESSTSFRMDSIPAGICAKSPAPECILPGCGDLPGRSPSASTLFS